MLSHKNLCGSKRLTSISRLTTPVDLRLGFFLRWFDGAKVEAVEAVAALEVAELLPLVVVIENEGTSLFSAIKKLVKLGKLLDWLVIKVPGIVGDVISGARLPPYFEPFLVKSDTLFCNVLPLVTGSSSRRNCLFLAGKFKSIGYFIG